MVNRFDQSGLAITKRYVKRLPINGTGTGFIEPDDDTVAYFHDITSKDYIHIGTENGCWCYIPIESIPSCDPSSKGTPITELVGDGIGDAITAVKTSSGVKLMANASGGTGTIRYMFTAEMNGREILIRNFDAE